MGDGTNGLSGIQMTLPSDLEAFVSSKIEAGQFESIEDVVSCALRQMKDQEMLTADDVDELRREIALGLSSLQGGERAPLDIAAIKADGRRVIEARREIS